MLTRFFWPMARDGLGRLLRRGDPRGAQQGRCPASTSEWRTVPGIRQRWETWGNLWLYTFARSH